MDWSTELTYQEACEKALEKSKDGCSYHVCALVRMNLASDEPYIAGYKIDEWKDDATVASYFYGNEVWRVS